MTRRSNQTVVQFALEANYGGGNPGSWGPTDAMEVIEPKFRIARDTVPRKTKRRWYGGSEHLVGARRAEIEFGIEMAPSGTAGTPPAWGRLLRACAMTEIVTGSRVEYLPISNGLESGMIRYVKDGMIYTARGCMGAVRFELPAYDIPMLRFRFWGFDTAAATSAPGAPAVDYSPFQPPPVLTDHITGDIRLGCTYSAGALSGGVALVSRGLEIDLGNRLSHFKLWGGERIDITDRDASGKFSVGLTAADEVAWRDQINVNQNTTLGLQYGSVAGQRLSVFCPRVQRVDPQEEDYEGRTLVATEIRCMPTGSGNDEVRIVVH
jgi:hypothetical protein